MTMLVLISLFNLKMKLNLMDIAIYLILYPRLYSLGLIRLKYGLNILLLDVLLKTLRPQLH